MATITGICNSALAKLGAKRILSIDDNSPSGQLCKEQYDKVKKAFLRGHLWNFAIVRKQLPLLTSEPVYEFDCQYALPGDCLRVVGMSGDATYPWKVEGRKIVTNNAEAYIKYISNVDEGLFDDSAAEALAYALAIDMCIPLTQSGTLKESLKDDYKKALSAARTFDGQESTGDRVYADTWRNARY